MEKRVVLAVVLTIAVIFLNNMLFPTAEVPPADGGSGGVSADTTGMTAVAREQGEPAEPEPRPEEVPGAVVQQAPPTAVTDSLLAPAEVDEDTVRVISELYDLQFSTVGAVLIGAELLEYESYAANGEGSKPVQLVREGDRVLGYRIAVGADTVRLESQRFSTDRAELRLSPENPRDSLVFSYAFPSGAARFLVVYAFRHGSYVVDVSGRLEGVGERGYAVLTSLGHGLKTNEKNPSDDYRQLAYVVRGQRGGIRSVALDKVQDGEIRTADGGPFSWVAVKNKYFLIALVASEGGQDFGGFLAVGSPGEHTTTMVTSVPVPAGSDGFAFGAYLGPQEYQRLEAVSKDLEHANPYGWRWMRPIIRPLVGIVMIILGWLHGFLGLAYGWVLILFGVMMRVILFPLYQKSMRAQLAQMQVQPLMKELQAKHKEDPQKLQQEMMKLYKEHNVNPLAGCLPMLLPMPVLFALFFVFQSTIQFRGVPFLWLPDLSLKDPSYIIPLIMGASMFLLSWIGQRGMEPNAQMKMMTWVMPVVFTAMFANFPSGLNLYYATSNLASLPQQLYLSKERQAARRKADQDKASRKRPEKKTGGG